jgi:hypothetical protein
MGFIVGRWTVSDGWITEDGTHLLTLPVIQKLNKDGKKPHKDELLSEVNVFKSQLDLMMIQLLEKGYLDRESNWQDVVTYSYGLSDKGEKVLETNRNQAKKFVSTVVNHYEEGDKESLYQLLNENRDSLWFVYYEGLVSEEDLKKLVQFLGLGVRSFWWDKKFKNG